MKILMISNMYPTVEFPSYGVFVKNFEESLVGNNINVDKIVLTKEPNKIIKMIKYIFFYIKIFAKCCLGEQDIVYCHYASHSAIPILLARKVCRFTLITNVHGSDVIPETSSQIKFQKYVKMLLNISNRVVVPSYYFKEVVSKKYNIAGEKIFISPSGGIDKNKFFYIENKDEIKEKYNIAIGKTVIGYVGRIDIGKGWDVLLKSIKILNDSDETGNIIFLIIGSGKQKVEFNRMIVELGLESNIVQMDLLPQSELNNIYNILDIFCFPTKREGESLGLVALESMMCGVPVLGSEIGALPEYIKEKSTGLMFETGNDEEMAKKILFLLREFENNKAIKTFYRENCIEKANEYESTKIKDELVSLLELQSKTNTLKL